MRRWPVAIKCKLACGNKMQINTLVFGHSLDGVGEMPLEQFFVGNLVILEESVESLDLASVALGHPGQGQFGG